MYKIKKSQLIVIWIVGVVIALVLLLYGVNEEAIQLFIPGVALIGFLVFYTLGWKSYHKDDSENSLYSNWKWLRKTIIILSVVVMALIVIPTISSNRTYTSTPTPTPLIFHDYYLTKQTPAMIKDLTWSLEGLYNMSNKLIDSRTGMVSNKTDGKFIEVDYLVENKTEDSKTMPKNWGNLAFKLRDDKNRIYYPFLDPGIKPGDGELDRLRIEYQSFSIKPGIPYRFSVFFEVAKDSNTFDVIVSAP